MRLQLVLSLVVLSAAAAADVHAPGFQSTVGPYPTGVAIRTLGDGTLITCDGLLVQRWSSGGGLIGTIGSFTVAGPVGVMAITPNEAFVLVGNSTTGEMIRVNVNTGAQTAAGNLPNNSDAVFENNTVAIVSAALCGAGCGNTLVRLDTLTGGVTNVAAVEGDSGPVSLDVAQNLYYATVDPSAAAGSSSVVRFLKSVLDNPPAPAFQASAGLVVIEVESSPPVGAWTSSTAFPGFTGSEYYRWDGPDLFSSPGVGLLTYEFDVTDPGDYEFHIHNRHENPAPDQSNDAWVRVDGGPWLKVFSNQGSATVGVWNWHSIAEDGAGVQFQAEYTLTAGRHTVKVSGRSNGFKIDRLVFYRDFVSDSQAQDLSNPESTLAPFNLGDAATIASGFDGATDLVHDPEMDQFFLAENNSVLGTNRIVNVSTTGVAANYLLGDPFHAIGNLDFTPEPNTGVYFPFQPPDNGELSYTRTDFGALNERLVLEPKRPEMSFTGPGADTGTGLVFANLDGVFPNGIVFFFFASAALVSPVEVPIFLGGLPLLHTGLLLEVKVIQPPFVADPTGHVGFTFNNNLGAIDLFGVQAIFTDVLGEVLGSSTTDFL